MTIAPFDDVDNNASADSKARADNPRKRVEIAEGHKRAGNDASDCLPANAEVVGVATPGERCWSCGKGGVVHLIRRYPGAEAEQMHKACAVRAWGARPNLL